MSAKFTRESRIRDVIERTPLGRELLYQHGYDAGEGFSDMLSKYASLEEAHRLGRLRDLDALLHRLNEA